MNRLKKKIRNIVRKIGFDIIRYEPKSHPLARRKRLLDLYGTNLVLDVGANIGQFGEQLREIGYAGRIVSFEPLDSEYAILNDKAAKDSLWEAYNFALGDKDEQSTINVAGNSFSSSILDIMPSHTKSAPSSEIVDHKQISIKTLDSMFDRICGQSAVVYFKIDTQGFEKIVLDGAQNSLEHIDTIQIEMSLIQLYKDAPLFDEMYRLLYERGYRLVALEPAFTDNETGHLLQVDGIFHRT